MSHTRRSTTRPPITRRDLLRYAAVGTGIAALSTVAPGAAQARDVLGTIVDYSADVPSAESIRAAGHVGAIRYVSDRRPGAEWMRAKPLTESEATALSDSGLEVVSCYQFGKADTADWRGGFDAGVQHARRGLDLHRAAGGPDDRPIYASIDDNPTLVEFTTLIAPYLLGWHSVVGRPRTGVYANSPTIDWAVGASLGSFYWQHDWGTPKGHVNAHAHLHQLPGGGDPIDGIDIDVNTVLAADYGQWSLTRL